MIRALRAALYLGFVLSLLLALGACSLQSLHPVFGGKPDEASQEKIRSSPQFDGAQFANEEETPVFTPVRPDESGLRRWLSKWWNAPKDKNPQAPLPSHALDARPLKEGEFVWLGHSGVLFRLDGKTLLSDPVFYRASPISLPQMPLPFVAEPFALQHPLSPENLPPKIDVVLISHDHFDHLDRRAIQELDERVRLYVVPLGVKAHLQRWGVADEKIVELDWHDQMQIGDIELIMTPARHFSGRLSGGHFATLWASWVLKSPSLSIYINGDSGYGSHYKEIGKRYGPFDLAMIEIGGYDEDWSLIHLFPEESVQAMQDLGATWLLPMHWARFDLAHHSWREPIDRLMAAVPAQGVRVTTPLIGQRFTLDDPPQLAWWQGVR